VLVAAGDIDAFAEAVIGLLSSPERIARFSRASRAWAVAAGPDLALARWRDLLESVIRGALRSP